MKRAILCIILFLALCAVAAGSYFYIVGTTTRLLNKVELVAYSFSGGDFETAREAAREADELWTDFRKRRFLIIDRDNVAEITATIARIRSLADLSSGTIPPSAGGEPPETGRELITECHVATALIRKYIDKQRLNVYNVL